MIPVTRSSMPDFEEFVNKIKPLWDSRWLSNRGALHQELELELANLLDSPNIALFSNGHLALETILDAFDLRDEVITTPFTFASTSHALIRKGLTPVFADIRATDLTLDPELIEEKITAKTTAILPVHVYGNICDVEAIQDIADRHGLRVIYDAAHAFNIRHDGVPIAKFGDASMFSFHATKVFHTIEGGAAVVRDPSLVPRLYQLQNFGFTLPDSSDLVGGNAKLNEISAAMGLCNLQRFDSQVAQRKLAYDQYTLRVSRIPGVRIPGRDSRSTHNYSYFPVLIDSAKFGATRDAVQSKLAASGIGARKYFAPLVSEFNAYGGRFDSNDTPVAKLASEQVLTLPLYADLSVAEVEFVCDVFESLGNDYGASAQ